MYSILAEMMNVKLAALISFPLISNYCVSENNNNYMNHYLIWCVSIFIFVFFMDQILGVGGFMVFFSPSFSLVLSLSSTLSLARCKARLLSSLSSYIYICIYIYIYKIDSKMVQYWSSKRFIFRVSQLLSPFL